MGHRIELGEVEAALQALDGILRVCCIYDEPNTKILAFYVGEPKAKEIIERLTERLPRFMIPNIFCRVEAMPITKNGKIDRKKLSQEKFGPKSLAGKRLARKSLVRKSPDRSRA